MFELMNLIIDTIFISIITINFFHLTLGDIMKNEILLLNHSTCNLLKEIDIMNETKMYVNTSGILCKTSDRIKTCKKLIAKNQTRILNLLNQ